MKNIVPRISSDAIDAILKKVPQYRDVVFKDISTDFAFVTRSTVQTKDTIEWEDGKEYPLVKLEISSDSHPFFTGKQKLVDTAGRVDKFYNRYSSRYKRKEEEE